MLRQQSNTSEEPKLRKNRGRKILIESDFDNGNINLLRQVTELQYRLEAVSDSKSATPKKTWFHFRVSAPKGIRIRLIIENVSIYENMYQDTDWAKPVMNDGNGWREVKDSFLTYRGQVGIIIDYTFVHQAFVYFAMAVPHSYNDSQNYLKELAFKVPDHIHYQDQIIGKSAKGLNLHLLKFTAKEHWLRQQKNNSSGHLIIPNLHTNENNNHRIHSEANIQTTITNAFTHIKKPIILITSRVHPGQVGSSHCLMGIIDFLTRTSNLQSYILLKMFQVLIIPIVNPDGVFQGHYRMDLNNTNLNRVYQQPSLELHPTVYRIKQLVINLINPSAQNINHSNKQRIQKMTTLMARKIMFHFDLHSHSCIKSSFIYGNAFDQIVTQTQSQLYCRLLQRNTEVFKYGLSHFGEKHMKMKDKGEPLTKQGCARVVVSKLANVVYSYTVQTAIFPYANKESLLPISNSDFQLSQNLYLENNKEDSIMSKYNIKNQLMIDNMLLGHGLMVTILDLLEKNPYSRIPNLQETLDTYRRQISQNLLQNEQRFKLLDIKAYQKVKNISKICKDQFGNKHQKYWDFLASDRLLSNAKWPTGFKMFEATNNLDIDLLRRKNRTKTETDYQKQANDFIYPKYYKRRYMNLQTQILQSNQALTQVTNHKQISPTKSSISQRNIQIQLQINPPNTQSNNHLPEIKISAERANKNRGLSHSLSKRYSNNGDQDKQLNEQKQINIETKQSMQRKELRQIKELKQKESTKNIVLSFIHDEMQKINTLRKNAQKSMAVQNRLASYKLVKKSTRSTKNLQTIGAVSAAANKYGIVLSSNNVLMSAGINNQHVENSQLLSQSKSKKKLAISTQTCQQIVNRRRNHTTNDDQEQIQFQQEEGIYYEEGKHIAINDKKQKQYQFEYKKQERHSELEQAQIIKGKKIFSQPKHKNELKGSLQKISQYPVYATDRDKDESGMCISSKKQLAKMKYSEIKKKNIIRQDLSNAVRLPQLRGINTSTSQSTHQLGPQTFGNNSKQQERKGLKNSNRVNINLNLNLNFNVCIDSAIGEVAGRARAATMPDQL